MAKEGFKFLLPAVVISAVGFHFFTRTDYQPVLYFSLAAYIVALFSVLFFRDPEREIPSGEDLILSPADGRLKKIEKSGDGTSLVLSIFISLFNVHINRVPVDGVVKEVSYQPGRFLPAFKEKASTDNERNVITIANEHGEVVLRQIAGTSARRIVCDLVPGQRVKKGERFGLIHFGSAVELTLPEAVELKVRQKGRVKAGETVVGVFRGE